MEKITRNLQQKVVENLLPNKVVMIYGARRVGKTVLINQIARQFTGKKMIIQTWRFQSQFTKRNHKSRQVVFL